jgi:pimeloyl-ACP methyl ester carboxylesterase
MSLRVRAYGDPSSPTVLVLHGGPGAPGHLEPLARGLAEHFHVLEPLQRGSGPEPLTVARHVADLDELVLSCRDEPPALVGSSWGAMLALAHGAAHPERRCPLVLIGCGTFDHRARKRLQQRIDERMSAQLRERLASLEREIADPDERLAAMGRLISPIFSYDLAVAEPESLEYDARAHRETWDDMVRLQDEGLYPASFSAIRAPVLMLHGAFDPHPGTMIRDSLLPFIPQLEYREWERCGHYPWLERAAREEFFAVLIEWLGLRLARGG